MHAEVPAEDGDVAHPGLGVPAHAVQQDYRLTGACSMLRVR